MRKTVEYKTRTERAAKSPEQALATLQLLCSRAERCGGDAMRLMSRWGVEPTERTRVLELLVEARFIDDGRYAAAYVREKSSLAGWGPHKIRAALAAKGVSKPLVEQALSQIVTETSHENLAGLLARKKRSVKAASAYELRGKLFRYGLSRGFDYEQVCAAVEKLVKESD